MLIKHTLDSEEAILSMINFASFGVVLKFGFIFQFKTVTEKIEFVT